MGVAVRTAGAAAAGGTGESCLRFLDNVVDDDDVLNDAVVDDDDADNAVGVVMEVGADDDEGKALEVGAIPLGDDDGGYRPLDDDNGPLLFVLLLLLLIDVGVMVTVTLPLPLPFINGNGIVDGVD
jgi:hypothetical protein